MTRLDTAASHADTSMHMYISKIVLVAKVAGDSDLIAILEEVNIRAKIKLVKLLCNHCGIDGTVDSVQS